MWKCMKCIHVLHSFLPENPLLVWNGQTEWNTALNCKHRVAAKMWLLCQLYGNRLTKPTRIKNKVLHWSLLSNWLELGLDKRNFWWPCCERDERGINARPNKMTPRCFRAAPEPDRPTLDHAADSEMAAEILGPRPDKMWHTGPPCVCRL